MGEFPTQSAKKEAKGDTFGCWQRRVGVLGPNQPNEELLESGKPDASDGSINAARFGAFLPKVFVWIESARGR